MNTIYFTHINKSMLPLSVAMTNNKKYYLVNNHNIPIQLTDNKDLIPIFDI